MDEIITQSEGFGVEILFSFLGLLEEFGLLGVRGESLVLLLLPVFLFVGGQERPLVEAVPRG